MTALPAPTAETGWKCPDCGLVPHPRHPPETAAAIGSLVERFGVLIRHADPDALLRRRGRPGSRSALDHASHLTHDLAVVAHHLRTLAGGEHRAPADPAAAAHDTAQATVVDALTRTGDELARTILGTTDADWQHATIGSHRALDLLTLILHEADHGFHEAERALQATPAVPAPRDEHGAWSEAAGDRPLRMR